MKCFVISLPTSVERQASVEQQLCSRDIEYSRFDAINVKADRKRYFHHCDERAFQLNMGRAPCAAEMGCYASHLMLWRTCRLLNEPIAIFEDDAGFSADTAAGLELVGRHIRRLGFVRLQEIRKRLSVAIVRQGRHTIDYCLRYPYGSMGYAISPRVADAFIAASDVFRAPLDRFIKDFWRHGQPLYALEPAIVRESPLAKQTTLVGRQQTSQNMSLRLQRWLRKRADFSRRAHFNAVQLTRHSRAMCRHADWRMVTARVRH